MKLYEYGMNYNPYTREEEPYLTSIHIPAENDEEASARLIAMLGVTKAKRCWLNDVRDY